MERHADFWSSKEEMLRSLISNVSQEILALEAAAAAPVLTLEEAHNIKAIWVLSGAGSYSKPIIDSPGDLVYKDKPWAQNSDRRRIDYAVKLSGQIKQLSGEEPFLIYNGLEVQVKDLLEVIEKKYVNITKEKLFIPKGKITRTLDQVVNFELPKIDFEQGDKIGIVSHAPHLCRVIRMANIYKPFPEEIKVKLFPIIFSDPGNEAYFAQNEIMGVIGYLSRGEASGEPYPFEI